MTSAVNADINEYLTRYAASLSAFDSREAASLWATPGMILDDQYAGILADRESMAEGLEGSYPLYRELGLASVTHECLRVEELTEAITLVQVRWLFHDVDDELLTDSSAYYILRKGGEGFQACVCIQIDDAEKLQSLAAERGIDLSAFGG